MRLFASFVLAVVFMTLSGLAFAQESVVTMLRAQNNSGENGLVFITPNAAGNGIIVNVSIRGEPAEMVQPMHIHTGTCASLGGVYKALSSVIGGHSETNVIGMTIDDLMRGTYAINVHKGEGLLVSTSVACADISKAAAQM